MLNRYRIRLLASVIAVVVSIFSWTSIALADQTQISNYSTARDIFWEELYPDGGKTLYCDLFAPGRGGDFNNPSC